MIRIQKRNPSKPESLATFSRRKSRIGSKVLSTGLPRYQLQMPCACVLHARRATRKAHTCVIRPDSGGLSGGDAGAATMPSALALAAGSSLLRRCVRSQDLCRLCCEHGCRLCCEHGGANCWLKSYNAFQNAFLSASNRISFPHVLWWNRTSKTILVFT